MEAAVALFAAMGTAGATAATAATSAAAWAAGTTVTAAGAATGLAAAGSTALTVLQGVATAGSVLATLSGGLAARGEAKTNARLAAMQGEQDYIDAERRALAIRRETMKKVGEARVAFAASGLDISSADAVVGNLEAQGDYETGVERSSAQMRKLQAGLRARQYRASGNADLIGAVARSAGAIADTGIDIAKRG